MSTHHRVRVELETRDGLDREAILASLASYRPTLERGPRGHVVVALTVPADDVVQAVQTAVAVTSRAVDLPVLSVEALPAEESARRAGLDPVPRLLSVSETATDLGVSRQAVLQRIESGSLPATRVGSAWAIPAVAVEQSRRTAGQQRESLADVAATWGGAGRWPVDESVVSGPGTPRPNAFDPIPLPPGANIGTTV